METIIPSKIIGRFFLSQLKERSQTKTENNEVTPESLQDPSSCFLSSGTCEICQESMNVLEHSNLVLARVSCGHIFCMDCSKNWIQNELQSFSTGEIRCPCHTYCKSKLLLSELSQLLSFEDFEMLQ